MFAPQPMELAVIALVILLLFGAKKLPELGRGVGDAVKELRDSLRGGEELPPSP